LTSNQGTVRYVTTEFGVGLSITIGIAAVLFWARRQRVAVQPDA
jgi:hypothetical protein